jgi:hypothetical protein
MRLSLDMRPGAIHQAIEKTDNASLNRFRFQFTEDPDFLHWRMLHHHSGDLTVAGKTVKMLMGKKYMESYHIHNSCRRWAFTEKEVHDRGIPRGMICTCGDHDKDERRKAAQQRDNAKAARKRKLERMSAESSDAANPFMETDPYDPPVQVAQLLPRP